MDMSIASVGAPQGLTLEGLWQSRWSSSRQGEIELRNRTSRLQEIRCLRIFVAAISLLLIGLSIRISQSPDWMNALGEFGTAIAHPIILPIVNLINQPAFVYIASAVILLSALCVIAYYALVVIRPQILAVERAEQEVRVLPLRSDSDWRSANAELDIILKRNGVMLSPWVTYLQESSDLRRLPSRRFALYAEADPSSTLHARAGMMAALPSYYTTIGLILTFVGLVVALYFASRGFRSGDMGEARQAIIHLLNASAFKFLTSVASLVSALFISLTHRLCAIRLRDRSVRLLTAVDLHLQNTRTVGHVYEQSAAELALAGKLDAIIGELAATRTAISHLQGPSERERAAT